MRVHGKTIPNTAVEIDGHTIELTNLDKVMYPETGTTKADVISYYVTVAEKMLPWCEWRPATRKRWVHGVGTADSPGPMFFQKNLEPRAPAWIRRFDIDHPSGTNTYPLVNDAATLVWLAQMSALEVHVPQWRFDAKGQQLPPDRLVIDLDPGEGAGLDACVEVALEAKALLADVGLPARPVTSGSKGIHLYASLEPAQTPEVASTFAHEAAIELERRLPHLVVSDMKKRLRTGKVLVDWSQNSGNKTTISPYSLRGRAVPTVAAPRTWDELTAAGFAQLRFDELLARLAK